MYTRYVITVLYSFIRKQSKQDIWQLIQLRVFSLVQILIEVFGTYDLTIKVAISMPNTFGMSSMEPHGDALFH